MSAIHYILILLLFTNAVYIFISWKLNKQILKIREDIYVKEFDDYTRRHYFTDKLKTDKEIISLKENYDYKINRMQKEIDFLNLYEVKEEEIYDVEVETETWIYEVKETLLFKTKNEELPDIVRLGQCVMVRQSPLELNQDHYVYKEGTKDDI